MTVSLWIAALGVVFVKLGACTTFVPNKPIVNALGIHLNAWISKAWALLVADRGSAMKQSPVLPAPRYSRLGLAKIFPDEIGLHQGRAIKVAAKI